MNSYNFTLHGAELRALARGGLWWESEGVLVVADLHLGKALRLARRGGGLLPPWEAVDTLERLDTLIREADPDVVICLGDSFDDVQAADDVEENARLWLLRLMAGRRWLWVEGNHDPGPLSLPGEHHASFSLGPLAFRHIAQATDIAEISGHYHPKASIHAKGASLTRPCFLIDENRVILPALGSLTGGMACHEPIFSELMASDAIAVLTGDKVLPIPMPRHVR